MRFEQPAKFNQGAAQHLRIDRGIYPYLGAAVEVRQLRRAASLYGYAAVPGIRGARLAMQARTGVLVDPAEYITRGRDRSDSGQHGLWACDEWLERERAARVPVLVTDTSRIARADQQALRKALRAWKDTDELALVMLPLEPWWLRTGLSCLIDEVGAAGRRIAVVLVHPYNGLDAPESVAGLLNLVSATAGGVVLMRFDVSAIGAVAHGAYAGFAGMSASLRHGPMPIRRSGELDERNERDVTPSVLVPALHDYHKAGKLPAIAAARQDLLTCGCSCCRGGSLLEISRLCEVNISRARAAACDHNVAAHDRIACQVLAAPRPRDAWWELCKAGADATASLAADGVSVPVKPWLRQWLELGSPSHAPVTIS